MRVQLKLLIFVLIFALDVVLAQALWDIGTKTGVQAIEAGVDEKAELKQIALTFDDGPNSQYTPQLLDGLRERGVQASFFLIGKNIQGNENIVRQMQADGHLIGNHSNTHTQLTKKTAELVCQEIEETNQLIYQVTGQRPAYIRPPFGSWSEELECTVPMTVVLWNVDPLDWKVKNTNKVVNHIVGKVKANSIILMHDSYPTSVEAALEVIDTLSAKGYTFVTVDELMID